MCANEGAAYRCTTRSAALLRIDTRAVEQQNASNKKNFVRSRWLSQRKQAQERVQATPIPMLTDAQVQVTPIELQVQARVQATPIALLTGAPLTPTSSMTAVQVSAVCRTDDRALN